MYVDAYVDVLLVMVLQDQCLEGILSLRNLTGLTWVISRGRDPMEGFRRAGTLGPLLAPNRCKLNMKLVELFMGHI